MSCCGYDHSSVVVVWIAVGIRPVGQHMLPSVLCVVDPLVV